MGLGPSDFGFGIFGFHGCRFMGPTVAFNILSSSHMTVLKVQIRARDVMSDNVRHTFHRHSVTRVHFNGDVDSPWWVDQGFYMTVKGCQGPTDDFGWPV